MVKQNRAEIVTRKRPEHAPAGQRVGGSPAGVGWCPIGETGDPGTATGWSKNSCSFLIVVFEQGAGPFPASNGHVTWILMRLNAWGARWQPGGPCKILLRGYGACSSPGESYRIPTPRRAKFSRHRWLVGFGWGTNVIEATGPQPGRDPERRKIERAPGCLGRTKTCKKISELHPITEC